MKLKPKSTVIHFITSCQVAHMDSIYDTTRYKTFRGTFPLFKKLPVSNSTMNTEQGFIFDPLKLGQGELTSLLHGARIQVAGFNSYAEFLAGFHSFAGFLAGFHSFVQGF